MRALRCTPAGLMDVNGHNVNAVPPPIFVGGAGRSGTTLLRHILDSHSRIACGPELKVLPRILGLRVEMGAIPAVVEWKLTAADLDAMWRDLVMGFLTPYWRASGKARIAEKSPNNAAFFPVLASVFPESPLIHIVRHGADVAASLLNVNWMNQLTGQMFAYNSDPKAGAVYWADIVRLARIARDAPGYYEIRYEDLITDPETTLKALFRHLGEPWEKGVLDHAAKPHNVIEGEEQVRRGFDPSAIGRWRRDLNPQQIDAVLQVAGPMLGELGYLT